MSGAQFLVGDLHWEAWNRLVNMGDLREWIQGANG